MKGQPPWFWMSAHGPMAVLQLQLLNPCFQVANPFNSIIATEEGGWDVFIDKGDVMNAARVIGRER